jgi:hypothetical protein
LWSTPAAAGKLAGKLPQTSIQESIHCLSHGLGAGTVKDIDSHLIEPHERPHAHATGDEDLHAVLRQVIDRGHAAALLVGNIGQSPDLLHRTVRNFHQSVKVAVTKMCAKGSLESARLGRGNGNDGTVHGILLKVLLSER